MTFYVCSHAKWPTTDDYNLRNPAEPIAIRDVSIDAMTEKYTTVQMPVQIGPKQCGNLKCKVDAVTGDNVMPLHVFAKLFPKCISSDGTSLDLHPSDSLQCIYHP